MEASEMGAPAAAEQTAPQTTEPTTPAPEAAPEQSTEPTPEPTMSDVMSAVTGLRQEFDQIRGGQEPEAPAGGLYDQLLGEPEDFGQESDLAGDPYAAQQQGPEGFDQNDPAVQQFEAYLDQAIQQRVAPIQEERQEEQLAAIEQKYPDILDEKVFPGVQQALDNAVRRSGNEALRFDPYMIELAYKATKAEQADAAAVPAEQVATDGSSLETGAGQSQAGPTDAADDYVQRVYGESPKRSVFG